jgi:hypothetical protein
VAVVRVALDAGGAEAAGRVVLGVVVVHELDGAPPRGAEADGRGEEGEVAQLEIEQHAVGLEAGHPEQLRPVLLESGLREARVGVIVGIAVAAAERVARPCPGDPPAVAEWRQRMGTPEAKRIYKSGPTTSAPVASAQPTSASSHPGVRSTSLSMNTTYSVSTWRRPRLRAWFGER